MKKKRKSNKPVKKSKNMCEAKTPEGNCCDLMQGHNGIHEHYFDNTGGTIRWGITITPVTDNKLEVKDSIKIPKKNSNYKDYKEMWEKWWKPLLELKEDVPVEVMKELADYAFVLDQVPAVYRAITNGKLSKTNYYASVIIGEYEQNINDCYVSREELEDIINDNLTAEQKIQSIMNILY